MNYKFLSKLTLGLLFLSLNIVAHEENEIISLLCKFESSPTLDSYNDEEIISIIINKKDKTLSSSKRKTRYFLPIPYKVSDDKIEYRAKNEHLLYEGLGDSEVFILDRVSLKLEWDWRMITSSIEKGLANNWRRIYQCERKEIL